MRGIWVNKGAEVGSYDRLKQLGFTHVFFDAHSHTRQHLEQARGRGFQVGVYSNPQWFGKPSPQGYRDILNKRLTDLGVNKEQCDVQVNIEKLALAEMGISEMSAQNEWVREFFYWWRRARASRPTSWTMEGHQGGWFFPVMQSGNLDGTVFVPQAYDGNMNRWDSWGVVKDLLDYGVDVKRVMPFLDAPEARIPYSEGFFYMEHRLG